MSSQPKIVACFGPTYDQAQDLGSPVARFKKVYGTIWSDGVNGDITFAEMLQLVNLGISNNHNNLSPESRSLSDQHPQSAITGLIGDLGSKASKDLATPSSDGLMSAEDKGKILSLDPAALARLVSPDFEGYPTTPTVEDPADSSSLIANTEFTQAAIALAIALKADLVGGKVPISQIPLELIARTWNVPSAADLVTLIEATPNDLARITEGSDAGDIYILTADDPTVLANWLNITTSGGVISINGHDGAVVLTLADFPDIQVALFGKAPLASPEFSGTPKTPTPIASSDGQEIANTQWVREYAASKAVATEELDGLMSFGDKIALDALVSGGAPEPGDIKLTAAFNPTGSRWFECNGQALSRTTYAQLFDAIGTSFGAGDGSTTFNLPNFQSRTPIGAGRGSGLSNYVIGGAGGAETVALAISQMPSHSHVRSAIFNANYGLSGSQTSAISPSASGNSYSSQGTGGNGSHTNMQPYLAVRFVIYVGEAS